MHHIEVVIPSANVQLDGTLSIPEQACGVVVFAHGSGSSRHSQRNRFVAEVLQKQGIATLLFDLLTPDEDQSYDARFDIGRLTERLLNATDWIKKAAAPKKIGYFGASTGAAAAISAAASQGGEITAVVSRGGRPDLAGPATLARLASPTLLIVGGLDESVISLNQQAYDLMNCKKELLIVPGATHLFAEAGTLEQAANLATRWFLRWFGQTQSSTKPAIRLSDRC